MTRRALVGFLLIASVMLLATCGSDTRGSPAPPTSPAASVELTIYAAASLRDAIEAAKAAYETANPGVTLVISTGSSAALATQIEAGAPADLFLSADTGNPQALVDDGLADGAPVDFANNSLVVIVPAGNPVGITAPADLARPGVKIVAAGEAVPITRYATQVVESLAREPGYPADFADAYERNIVSREDNVQAVVAKLELGEGDAAIVYRTDATDPTKVAAIEIPAGANVLATYAGVVVKASSDPDAAAAFLDWLAGADGQAVLGGFGFLPPS